VGTVSPKFIAMPSFPSLEDNQVGFAGLVASFGTLFPLSHPEAVMNLHLTAAHVQPLAYFVSLRLACPFQFIHPVQIGPFLPIHLFTCHSLF
jgi:hypothetical protein